MQRCKASNLPSQSQEKYIGKSCHLSMYVCKIQRSLYEGPKMSHSKQKNDKGKPNLVFLIEIFIRISTGKVMASLIETFSLAKTEMVPDLIWAPGSLVAKKFGPQEVLGPA